MTHYPLKRVATSASPRVLVDREVEVDVDGRVCLGGHGSVRSLAEGGLDADRVAARSQQKAEVRVGDRLCDDEPVPVVEGRHRVFGVAVAG